MSFVWAILLWFFAGLIVYLLIFLLIIFLLLLDTWLMFKAGWFDNTGASDLVNSVSRSSPVNDGTVAPPAEELLPTSGGAARDGAIMRTPASEEVERGVGGL